MLILFGHECKNFGYINHDDSYSIIATYTPEGLVRTGISKDYLDCETVINWSRGKLLLPKLAERAYHRVITLIKAG